MFIFATRISKTRVLLRRFATEGPVEEATGSISDPAVLNGKVFFVPIVFYWVRWVLAQIKFDHEKDVFKKFRDSDTREKPHMVFFDGACKFNGLVQASGGAGMVIRNEKGKVIYKRGVTIIRPTNNRCEYLALLLGIAAAVEMRRLIRPD